MKQKPSTSKQAGSSNNTAEVFVLPPELLAKLGINVNHIQNTTAESQTVPGQVKETEQSINHRISRPLPDSEDASSIRETANLMKESVFLSPTFFQNQLSIAPNQESPVAGETIDIVNTKATEPSECNSQPHQCNGSCVTITPVPPTAENISSKKHHDSVIITSKKVLEQKVNAIGDNYKSKVQIENHDGNEILSDVLYQSGNIKNIRNDKSDVRTPIDDHSDEAYLSDCSNSNSNSPERIISEVKVEVSNIKNKEISHENYFNNEQLDHVQDMDVICSPTDAIFTPVIIDASINAQQHHSDLAAGEVEKQQKLVADKLIKTKKNRIELSDLADDEVEKQNTHIADKFIEPKNFTNQSSDSAAGEVDKQQEVIADKSLEPKKFRKESSDLAGREVKKQHKAIADKLIEPKKIKSELSDLAAGEEEKKQKLVVDKLIEPNKIITQTSDSAAGVVDKQQKPIADKLIEPKKFRTESSDLAAGEVDKQQKLIADKLIKPKKFRTESFDLAAGEVEKQQKLVADKLIEPKIIRTQSSDSAAGEVDKQQKNIANKLIEPKQFRTELSDLAAGEVEKQQKRIDDKLIEPKKFRTELSDLAAGEVEKQQKRIDDKLIEPKKLTTESSEKAILKNTDKQIIKNDSKVEDDIRKASFEKEMINFNCELSPHLISDTIKVNKASEKCDEKVSGDLAKKVKENVEVKKKSISEPKPDIRDKVQEIATYLSQIANIKKKNVKKSSKNAEKKIKVDPVISKLCVQGVEKPGGHLQGKNSLDRYSKTYQKSNKKRQIPQSITSEVVMISDEFQQNTHIENAEVTTFTNLDKFCICYDFGDLAYYDCEMLYEHIHFWMHNSVECDLETLFSIFNDNHDLLKSSFDFVEDVPHNERDISIQNTICWNEMNVMELDQEEALVSAPQLSRPKSVINSAKNQKSTLNNIQDSSILTKLKLQNSTKAKDTDKNTSQPCLSGTGTNIIPTKLSKIDQADITRKPVKRYSNTTTVSVPSKKVKSTQQKDDNAGLSQHSTQADSTYVIHSREIKTENNFSESIDVTENESTKCSLKDDIDYTTYEHSDLPDDSMDAAVTFEDSLITDNMDITTEITAITDVTLNEAETSEAVPDDFVICGICGKSMENSQWFSHNWKEHDYMAWLVGETPLDLENEKDVKAHLQTIARTNDGLICSRCDLNRKNAKTFLRHIRSCEKSKTNPAEKEDKGNKPCSSEEEDDSIVLSKLRERNTNLVFYSCGVCNKSVKQTEWIEHIRVKHKYLAWTTDEEPINIKNEAEVRQHLTYISKYHGGLLCNVCNSKWAYVKKYLRHIENCAVKQRRVVTEPEPPRAPVLIPLGLPAIVTCGFCKLDVAGNDWIPHIQRAHDYIAWIGGEEPIDPDNPEQLKQHLDKIVRAAGELVCMKCGERRKHTYAYLQHKSACDSSGFEIKVDNKLEKPIEKGKFVCGVCNQSGKLKDWRDHALSKHYNVAWMVGEVPINVRNFYAVEKYIKEYRKIRGLVCYSCNETRVSCYGFYAHILTCGKSDEEKDIYFNICEVCQKKYLCIYRSQHMAAHRDSDNRRMKREELAKKKAEEEEAALMPQPELTGKRKAAEKAKKVIEKHSTNTVDGKPVCGCGSIFRNVEAYAKHSCGKKTVEEDEEDDWMKTEQVSSAEEDDENEDELTYFVVSDEEEEAGRKRRSRAGESVNKVIRLQYKIENQHAYLVEAFRQFSSLHYTSENLFNIWRGSEIEVIPPEMTAFYLPLLKESCKIKVHGSGNKYNDEGWITYKRFEARKKPGYSFFTGGATQCISWAPPRVVEESVQNIYLAISTHRGPDVPRYTSEELPHFPGSLQIWDFGQFEKLPRCAACIAHDYGVIWSMDWCPSGARDDISRVHTPQDEEVTTEEVQPRLGLLAIACSNGAAYILAVPCPPPETSETYSDPLVYKLKPVAELRLNMYSERRVYQATSIHWSQQKGHSVIIVGYSDGTTALYDLNTDSPFLVTTEDDVTIYYPFQDRKSEYSSITSVGLFTTSNEKYAVGGQFSTSTTGGTLAGRGARPTSRCHLAVASAIRSAHWPTVTVAGDIPFMRAVSEVEWWGAGRRVGAARSWAACSRCGRTASYASPAVRFHKHHPAYPEIKKVISALLLMTPLNHKPKPSAKDDLSLVVEPMTYEETVDKYGLQYNLVSKTRNEQLMVQSICSKNEFRPDRFPLSDVVAMAFCPSTRFHDRLALATHTGMGRPEPSNGSVNPRSNHNPHASQVLVWDLANRLVLRIL